MVDVIVKQGVRENTLLLYLEVVSSQDQFEWMNKGSHILLLNENRRWTVICLNWDWIAELILNDPICLLLIQHLPLLRLRLDLPSPPPYHHLTLDPYLTSHIVTVILLNFLTFPLSLKQSKKGLNSCPSLLKKERYWHDVLLINMNEFYCKTWPEKVGSLSLLLVTKSSQAQ